MAGLATTVAIYDDMGAADRDWAALEAAAKTSDVDLADAALVRRRGSGEVVSVHRQEHHGWGKGAVAGAIVGLIFPPSLLGSAVVGGLGGALVARVSRCLDRGDIKDLGEVMDRSEIALVVVSATDSVEKVHEVLGGARHKLARGDMPADDLLQAMDAAGLNPR